MARQKEQQLVLLWLQTHRLAPNEHLTAVEVDGQVDEIVPEEVLDEDGNAQVGFAGIPVRDEIRLSLDLQNDDSEI